MDTMLPPPVGDDRTTVTLQRSLRLLAEVFSPRDQFLISNAALLRLLEAFGGALVAHSSQHKEEQLLTWWERRAADCHDEIVRAASQEPLRATDQREFPIMNETKVEGFLKIKPEPPDFDLGESPA